MNKRQREMTRQFKKVCKEHNAKLISLKSCGHNAHYKAVFERSDGETFFIIVSNSPRNAWREDRNIKSELLRRLKA